MDLQLYPHMINIAQGGLCTGSGMSNYGPTVSDCPPVGTAPTRHAQRSTRVMSSSPRFSPRRANKVAVFDQLAPSRNDGASIKPSREAHLLFLFSQINFKMMPSRYALLPVPPAPVQDFQGLLVLPHLPAHHVARHRH